MALLGSAVVLHACGSDSGGTEPVVSLSLNPATVNLFMGEMAQLNVTVSGSSASVQYASSTPATAVVSSTGLVTAVGLGTATITATVEEVSDQTEVTVDASSISLDQSTPDVVVGGTVQLTATITGGVGLTTTWSSSDESVATVDQNGLVTGVAVGNAAVSAAVDGQPGVQATAVTQVLFRDRGAFVLVSNRLSDNVSVVDLATFTEVSRIDVGTRPWGVAIGPDQAFAYVTNLLSNDVSVIDLASNEVTATIPVGAGPRRIAIRPDGGFAYVPNLDGNTLSVIDLANLVVVDAVGVGAGPNDVAIHPDGTYAYVPNRFDGSVTVVDLASNTVVEEIFVGGLPRGVAVRPDGAFAYVTNAASSSVSVIDLLDNSLVATIVTVPEPFGIDVTPDGALAYVAHFDPGNVSVMDLTTNSVTETTAVGFVQRDIAIGPEGDFAYVSGNEGLWMIDLTSNSVVTNITLGQGPDGVAVFRQSASPVNPPEVGGG